MQLLPQATLADIRLEIQQRRRNKIKNLFPDTGPLRRELYKKHMEFFAEGSAFRIRELRAANRVGKTIAGAFEVVCHLTGIYPDWWTGKRFDRAVNALVAGESGRLVRDSIQIELMGQFPEPGTGMIPFDTLIERRPKMGIPEAIDTAQIKHVSGRNSILQFQSYDQGREAFQATTRDVIWLDEEPPLAIYTEALTRTMTTNGIVIVTFTPLKGVSDTVLFLEDQAKKGKISLITATWDDAPHLSEKDKAEMLAAYPPHQRDARTKGIPALGSGAIYSVPESEFIIPAFELPLHWRRGYSLDVGWNRTAAFFFAYDADADTMYFYDEHYRGQAEPAVHAQAILARGKWMMGVIDPASHGRNQKDGDQLFSLYEQLGLKISNAKNGVETGIYEVYQRLSSNRLKVFSNCVNFLAEYRLYRRDENGKIVKENDHLMDCLTGDTLILTAKGIYPISELVGTDGYVFAPDGRLVAYRDCGIRRKNSAVVDILFDNDVCVRCTKDHLFLTENGWESPHVGCQVLKWTPFRLKLCRLRANAISDVIITFVGSIFHTAARKGIKNTVATVGKSLILGLQKTVSNVEKNMKVVGNNRASVIRIVKLVRCEPEDVYCMDVPDGHAFVLANGLISHNCLRYAVTSGIDVAKFPDAYREKLGGNKSSFIGTYDPLDPKYIEAN